MQRRGSEYIGKRMPRMELLGRSQRGRPKRRCMGDRGYAESWCERIVFR